MPTYEYACSSCGNQWEEVQKISAAALEECPKCHQATAKRQISGGRFILKGGGWYADLYSSTKPGKKEDAKSSGSTEAKSSGESKPSGSGDSGASSSSGSSGSSGSSSGSTGGGSGSSGGGSGGSASSGSTSSGS